MLVTMSAFPESGRSDHQNSSEIRVRFRPEAATWCPQKVLVLPVTGEALQSIFDRQ